MSHHVSIASYPNNPRVLKSQIVAAFNGVKIEEQANFKMGETNKTAEFLAVNPFGQVPTLFTDDQHHGVFESTSIARYVARLGESTHKLYGKDILEASRIDAFLDADANISYYLGSWVYPLIGYGTVNEEKQKEGKERVKKYLLGLNHALNGHKYLVGDSVSLADIVLFCSLIAPFTVAFDEQYLADVPNVVSWYNHLAELPQFAGYKPIKESLIARKK